MTTLLPLALMLMQVGIDPNSGQVPGIPEELRDRPPRGATAPTAPAPTPPPAKLKACLDGTGASPASAIAEAQAWLAHAKGVERAQAGHCLGVAQTENGDWAAASASFTTARDTLPTGQSRYRAQLGLIGGAAALAGGDAARALTLLDTARGDAAGTNPLLNDIAVDRSRALVALNRIAEARVALGEARAADPADAEAWLLSATLSRREGDLASAQSQIEKGATLAPRDPAIGLEAGVIAALGGNDAAARKSFESVVLLAPDSQEAKSAKAYLAQLKP